MADVFTWPMQAYKHLKGINALREEVIAAHQMGSGGGTGVFPIVDIFYTLPIMSPETQDAVDRGVFSVTGSRFFNSAADSLIMNIRDPAMGDFMATVPAILQGNLTVNGGTFLATFDNPIELEIAQLESLGVGRSRFQSLFSLQVSSDECRSILVDRTDPNKQTHIVVALQQLITLRAIGGQEILRSMALASGSCGGSGGGTGGGSADWYVIKRNDGLCFTNDSLWGYPGGSANFTVMFGPDTESQCDQWIRSNCDPAYEIC